MINADYEITLDWLTDRKDSLWIHCKDLITIDMLRELQIHNKVDLNYFFHDEDDCTITSKGDLWVYPGKQPVKNSIAVMRLNGMMMMLVCVKEFVQII